MFPARFFLLLATVALCLKAKATEVVPVNYAGPEASQVIGRYLYLLEEGVSVASPGEAMDEVRWTRSDKDVPNLGISDNIRWVRFDLHNTSPSPRLVVQVPYPELDEFAAYHINGREVVVLANIGQAVIPEHRSGAHREMAFDVDIPKGSTATILLRLRSTKQLQIPLVITTPSEFGQSRSFRNLFIGGYFGIMMVMALYNLFVFFSIRDKSYLYYVLYILCLCFAQLTLQGVGQAYFWSDFPWFSSKASVLFTLSSMVFAGGFIRHFMGTRSVTPKLDIGLRFLMMIIMATIVLHLVGFSLLAYQVAQMLSGSYSLFIIVLAITAIRAGSREARFFLIAWAAFLIGVVLYILKDVGALPLTPLTQYSMPVGSVGEAILLSFGLADRINVLRREKEASQAAALLASQENERIIREQNLILEEKVQERTYALQETNEHLKRTQTQLVNSEKMASLGQLTAGIAHEINNPINFITSNIIPLRRNITEIVEVMQGYRSLQPEHAQEQLKVLKAQEKKLGIAESIEELDDIIGSIAEGSSRTAEIVRGLRNFSRLDEDDLKESDLNEGVRSTLSLLSPQYRDKVIVDLELGDIPLVECYPGKVNQVFMNVLTNGVQATLARTDGIQPRIVISSSVSGDNVVVSIKDNGVGMTEDVKTHMFDPFYTTKPVGEGTGLGLAIVYGIVQDHQGSIAVESVVGQGSEFKIILPIRRARLNERRA
ncbi:MAG: hypothetical protein JNL43_01565 [Flavobacteriales bacterium]|nr:hypothetical protein [Flavobacteriales bacterium]